MAITLNLLVIGCSDIEESKTFYEKLGLVFDEEQHGNGPRHFSCVLDGLVFELYPLGKNSPTTSTRLGFEVESVFFVLQKLKIPTSAQRKIHNGVVINDPDGHSIELSMAKGVKDE